MSISATHYDGLSRQCLRFQPVLDHLTLRHASLPSCYQMFEIALQMCLQSSSMLSVQRFLHFHQDQASLHPSKPKQRHVLEGVRVTVFRGWYEDYLESPFSCEVQVLDLLQWREADAGKVRQLHPIRGCCCTYVRPSSITCQPPPYGRSPAMYMLYQ